MLTVTTYAVYVAVSLAVTVWVATTLFRSGRVFLIDAMHGDQKLADSVNRLLVVGFYLLNVGYVSLALRIAVKPRSLEESIEILSYKLGVVLLVLGMLHFFNVAVFSKMRHRARASNLVPSAAAIAARDSREPAASAM